MNYIEVSGDDYAMADEYGRITAINDNTYGENANCNHLGAIAECAFSIWVHGTSAKFAEKLAWKRANPHKRDEGYDVLADGVPIDVKGTNWTQGSLVVFVDKNRPNCVYVLGLVAENALGGKAFVRLAGWAYGREITGPWSGPSGDKSRALGQSQLRPMDTLPIGANAA